MTKSIIGPVIPLPVAYNKDFEIDPIAMEKYVDFLASAGIPNVMTTVGTSRYNLLSWDEIKQINAAVVKGARGRCKTIVANPTTGGIRAAIEFGKHAESIGADYYLVYFPERFYGDDNTYAFFEAVADALSIDIIIHEMPMRNGLGPGTVQYSIPLLKRLLDIPNIVGLKEEALDAEYSNEVLKAVGHKAEIIGAGGGMSRYLYRDFDLGAKAFLGGLGNFVPSIELEFFEAISSGRQARAKSIVEEIELPYFEKVVPMGWHPHLKGVLGIKGLMPSYDRPPMKQLSEDERSLLTQTLKANQWL